MRLSRIVSEIDGDSSRKSQNFPTYGYRRWGQKNYNGGAIRQRKKFDDIVILLDTIHQRDLWTDRKTDGRTPGESKDCANA